MNLKRKLDCPALSPAERAVVSASDLMKQVELMTGIRKRIREGYYSRPEVLADIARQLSRRLHS